MLRAFLLTLFSLLFLAAPAQEESPIRFDKVTHNFGTFAEENNQTRVFRFTNVGDKPLVVHQALPSCGCTVADFTKTPVQPGKTGEVKITYSGRGRGEGYFKKLIVVTFNGDRRVRLYIEGTMTKGK